MRRESLKSLLVFSDVRGRSPSSSPETVIDLQSIAALQFLLFTYKGLKWAAEHRTNRRGERILQQYYNNTTTIPQQYHIQAVVQSRTLFFFYIICWNHPPKIIQIKINHLSGYFRKHFSGFFVNCFFFSFLFAVDALSRKQTNQKGSNNRLLTVSLPLSVSAPLSLSRSRWFSSLSPGPAVLSLSPPSDRREAPAPSCLHALLTHQQQQQHQQQQREWGWTEELRCVCV